MKNVLTFLCLCLSGFSFSQNAISGTITDEMEMPVAGVKVSYLSRWTLSDLNGLYSLDSLPDGMLLISLEKVGFPKTFQKVDFTATADGGSRNRQMDLLMSSLASTTGMSDTSKTIENVEAFNYISSLVSVQEIIYLKGGSQPSPITFLNVNDIKPLNNGQDMPYLLRSTPSLVTTSDAGNGIGYTGMWIRGSDGSRINVTINGVALNDPESQQVYWVDLPDLGSSADQISIQRGVGSSTNGTGAFGASINVATESLSIKPFAEMNNGFGSFNTFKNTVRVGSGLIDERWTVEARLSRITSDGYVDRASSDLKSFHLSAEYKLPKTKFRLLTMGGNERTYQSWYGTPESRLNGDTEAMITHAANEGLNDDQLSNLLNAGRTYNYYLYENEVDDYTQNHYQLHVSHDFSPELNGNLTFFYTKGAGYYEQYREKENRMDYGLSPILLQHDSVFSDGYDDEGQLTSNAYANSFQNNDFNYYFTPVLSSEGDSIGDGNGNYFLDAIAQIERTDVVRQRWLKNDYYGVNGSMTYRNSRENQQMELTLGWSAGSYDGHHFGTLQWMQYAGNTQPGDEFYRGKSHKSDLSAYLKGFYAWNYRLKLFLDVQTRMVRYDTKGTDVDLRNYSIDDDLIFFNPKVGMTYRISRGYMFYTSASVAHREPARTDYVDSPDGKFPKPESMIDFEAGARLDRKRLHGSANLYLMQYKDQLVPTGELNDVGSPLRTNVPESYRAGLELEASYTPLQRLTISGNITFSRNRIGSFDEVVYNYTNGLDVINTTYENTNIAFSPDIISALQGEYYINLRKQGDVVTRSVRFGALIKHVGRQYLDNTTDESRLIPDYTVADVMATYSTTLFSKHRIEFSLWLMNVLDRQYVSNGYSYSYIYGDKVTENFYYPQAGRNWMGSVVVLL